MNGNSGLYMVPFPNWKPSTAESDKKLKGCPLVVDWRGRGRWEGLSRRGVKGGGRWDGKSQVDGSGQWRFVGSIFKALCELCLPDTLPSWALPPD